MSRAMAARVLWPGKKAEYERVNSKLARIAVLMQGLHDSIEPLPYTEENLDTMFTMFLYAVASHNLPHMFYWRGIGNMMFMECIQSVLRDVRIKHQAERLMRITDILAARHDVLLKELQDLQLTIQRG